MPNFNRMQLIALAFCLTALVPTIIYLLMGVYSYWPFIFFGTLVVFAITLVIKKKEEVIEIHIPDPLARVKARAVTPTYTPDYYRVTPYVDPAAEVDHTEEPVSAATPPVADSTHVSTITEQIKQKFGLIVGILTLVLMLIQFKLAHSTHSWLMFHFGLISAAASGITLLYYFDLQSKLAELIKKEQVIVKMVTAIAALLLVIIHKWGIIPLLVFLVATVYYIIVATNSQESVKNSSQEAMNALNLQWKHFLGTKYSTAILLGVVGFMCILAMKFFYFGDVVLSELWEERAHKVSIWYVALLVVFAYVLIDTFKKPPGK